MRHPFSPTCTCYDCTATGTTICTRTRRCWLRHDHAGECMGTLAFTRFTLRTIWRELRGRRGAT